MTWKGWTRADKRQWRYVTKPEVMARDGGMCRVQLPGTWQVLRGVGDDRVLVTVGCTRVATQVHHTLGSHTKNDMRYVVASCFNCNNRVGDPTKAAPVKAKPASWC